MLIDPQADLKEIYFQPIIFACTAWELAFY